ncbi:MAG: DUF4382 domain-containing protein [Desulfatitalea sp.]|nr:DUF4382 domain-containing protein [Desulfatitalea sp.]NNK01259.1 DUF4382 domain-containing protein [Desulfatitalea sp.]
MKASRFFFPGQILLFFGFLITAAALTACGGGSAVTADGDSIQTGEIAISLTDAKGDFASYTVDVLALTLTKANGAEVSTLPVSTRIDFAQYTDMTEFLTAATIPSGAYVAARMTLDYSNADIWVEDEQGNPVQVVDILDENGDPLVGQVAVTVHLEDRSRLVVAPGIPVHLLLDFDLKATNDVTFDEHDVPTVSVDPYLVADVDCTTNKIHRLRGLLDKVNADESTFSVYIRPFYAALRGSHGQFGAMTVITDADTLFDIDGQAYQGQNGLTAMQTLDPLSAVVVEGDLTFNPLRFKASQVYAGTSVPWGDQDIVSGTVKSRTGNQLTVQGATLVREDGSVIFHDQATVTVGDDTRVTRQLSADLFSAADISVGQRVIVFGTLTNDDPLNLTLDAAQGHVRMKMAIIRGTVAEVDAEDEVAQLTMDLQSINMHRIGIFNFSGTGTNADSDADPNAYQVNTGNMELASLTIGRPVKARGFVQPFGAAPQDFNAMTLIGAADMRAFMRVHWQPASAEAFETISSEGLLLNLQGVGRPHHLLRGWVHTDLTALDQSWIVPGADGLGLFVLAYRGVVQVFLTFDDFTDELKSVLADGRLVKKVRARGTFDDATGTLTANLVDIRLTH